jgi:hypothetical protein
MGNTFTKVRENLDQRIRPDELPASKLELYFVTSQRKVKVWYYNLYKRQRVPFPCPKMGIFYQSKAPRLQIKKADHEASLSTLYRLEIKN